MAREIVTSHGSIMIDESGVTESTLQIDGEVGPGAPEEAWMLADGQIDRESIKLRNAAMYGLTTLIDTMIFQGVKITPEIEEAVAHAAELMAERSWESEILTFNN